MRRKRYREYRVCSWKVLEVLLLFTEENLKGRKLRLLKDLRDTEEI